MFPKAFCGFTRYDTVHPTYKVGNKYCIPPFHLWAYPARYCASHSEGFDHQGTCVPISGITISFLTPKSKAVRVVGVDPVCFF